MDLNDQLIGHHRRSQIIVLGLVLLLAVNIPVGVSMAVPEAHGQVARATSRACQPIPPPPDVNGERWGDWVIDCPNGEINLTFEQIKIHGSIIVTNGTHLRLASSSKIYQLFDSTHHYFFKVQESSTLYLDEKSEVHSDRFVASQHSDVLLASSKLYSAGSFNFSGDILTLNDSSLENKGPDGGAGEAGGDADLIINTDFPITGTDFTIRSTGGQGGPGKPGGSSNAIIYASSGVLSQVPLNISGGNGGLGQDASAGNGTPGGPGGNSKLRIMGPQIGNLDISSSSISVLGGLGGRGGNGASGQSIDGGSGGDGDLGGLAELDISAKSLKIEHSTILVSGGSGGRGGTGGPTQKGNGGNGGEGASGMGSAINISVTGTLAVDNSKVQSVGGSGGDGGFFGLGPSSQGIPGSAGNGGPSSLHLVTGSFKDTNSTLLAVGGPGGIGGLGAILGGTGGFGGNSRFELRASDKITNDGLGTRLSELGSQAGEGGNGGDAVGSTGNGGGQRGPGGSGGSCTSIFNATNRIDLKHTHLRCYRGQGGQGSSPGSKGNGNITIDTVLFNATASTIEGTLTGFDNNDKGALRNTTVETSPIAIIAPDQCTATVKVWWTLSINIPHALSNETWEISVYSGSAEDGNLVATAMVQGGPNKYATFEVLGEMITCKGTAVNNYTVIGRNIGSHVYSSNLTLVLTNNTVKGLDVGCYLCPPPVVTITNPPTPGILMNDSQLAPCKPPDINTSNPGCFVFKGDTTSGDTVNAVVDEIKVWLIRDGNETFFFKTDSNPPVVLIQRGQGLAQWSFGWDVGDWNYNTSSYVYPAGEWTILVSVHEKYVNLPNEKEGLWSKTVSMNFTVVHASPPILNNPPKANSGNPVVYTIPYGKSGVEVPFEGATITSTSQTVIRIEWDYNGDNVVDWSYTPTNCPLGSTCPVPVTKHIYSKTGIYNAILCAVDENGKKGCDTKKVQIVKGEAPTVFGVPTPLLIALTAIIVVISSIIIAALVIASLSEATKYSIMAFILVPLYTRLKKEEMLDNYTRGEIRGYIVANPGTHYSRIKRDLNLNNGTLIYHLSTLEREGFVYSHRDDYYRRFYPRGRKPRPGPNLTTVQESIIEILLDNPGLTTEDIAKHLNKSRKVTNYHLVWLRRSGLIEAKDDGRRKTYTVIYEDETEASQDGIKDGLEKGLSKGPSEDEEDEPSGP